MPNARGRFVNFRVTDDEFKQLKLACDQQGASFSAFARKTILTTIVSNGNVGEMLADLEHRVSTIENSLSRFCKSLSSASVHAPEKQK